MNKSLEDFRGVNCVAYGKARDEHVVKLIRSGTAFTRLQIQKVIFLNRKSAKRISQYTLARLCKQEEIKKWQRAPQFPSIYYIKKPKRIDHTLLINDVYCAFMTQKKSWHTIDFRWSYPILGGKVFADAMIIINDANRNNRRVVFIEVERNPRKRFNKPEQYKKIYDADWVHEEWAIIKNNVAIFPLILIITDENLNIKSKLKFIISNMQEVNKDVYSLIGR